jgi:predicted nucleic acid-binding protein
MDRNSAHLYLSVITVAEVESGIAKSRRTGAFSKAKRLADWLETVLHLYGSRVLSLDLTVARGLGPLMDHARGLGQTPGLADLAIAATARVHGLTVLTRNLRHFSFPGVPVHDPFDSLPS